MITRGVKCPLLRLCVSPVCWTSSNIVTLHLGSKPKPDGRESPTQEEVNRQTERPSTNFRNRTPVTCGSPCWDGKGEGDSLKE